MRIEKRSWQLIAVLLAILCIEMTVSVLTGKYPLSWAALLQGEVQSLRVFYTLRLPRTCMAVAAGFGLGTAGLIYQLVFRNPLASPDIIGVSSGASAGAAFAILFLSGTFGAVTFSAFAGSLLAVAAVMILTTLAPHKGDGAIVLAGLAIHSLAQTVLMMLKLTADPERELASIEYWIMGSFNGMTLDKLPGACIVCGICFFGLVLLYRQILILSVEDEEAALLGIPVEKMRLFILLLATLMVAAIVSVTGIVSFIGLLAPHCAKILMKHHRISLMWVSGLIGSILLCMADILARSVSASELPVSIFTSLLGAPFLLFLMVRRRNYGE